MSIAFQSGYVLPGGDKPLKYPRILHNGNRFRVKTVTASAAASGYPGVAADAGDTVDRWRPFSNLLSSPDDFSLAAWVKTNVTVSADGQTLTETVAAGEHDISQAFTFTAVEHVLAFKVERQTVPKVRVRANDGTTSFTCIFDLRDGTVGAAANCTGQIKDLGNDQFLVSIRFVPLAAAGVAELQLATSADAVSYTGATTNSIKVLSASVHPSSASLRYELFTAQPGDVFAIAGHNLGTGGGRVSFEHDSNVDDVWTSLGTLSPVDNSPIFFIHTGVTSIRWGVVVDRGVLPELAVLRVGKLLQFERPFYAGFTVPRMNRATEIVGNISGSGELLGRSRKRTILRASYSWTNLTYAWVRANLDGVNGLIQSAEVDPLFVAWRPESTQDVDYLMRAEVTAPQATGTRDLHNFSMSGEAYAYE